VDVEEVRHVGDVVDDLAAIAALDEHRIPPPFGPFVAGGFGDVRNPDLLRRRVALVVIPDEQQSATDVGGPRPGTGQSRGALGVGHQLAFAVAAPAPIVERAGDLVALDGALGQVSAHVAAVSVEHLHLAVRVGEDDQHGAEDLDAVRLAVQVIPHRPEAVPATCVPVRQRAGVDLADSCGFGSHGGPPVSVSLTRTRYSF
jgi:hypothetical protein